MLAQPLERSDDPGCSCLMPDFEALTDLGRRLVLDDKQVDHGLQAHAERCPNPAELLGRLQLALRDAALFPMVRGADDLAVRPLRPVSTSRRIA